MAPNGDLAELFDRMMLRPALADIFGSIGMEGDSRWQAASQVRLLLTKGSAIADPMRSAALFGDPDARWLAGINQSNGTTWLNKEQFEELLTWLQVPKLIEIARATGDEPRLKPVQQNALNALEKGVAHAIAAAETAHYQLDAYLASFTRQPKEPTATT